LLRQLKVVSDEWLQMAQGSEKQFSLGWFDEDYLQECEIAVVHTPKGEISAFTNIISEYQLNEVTNDMMRHRKSIENGTMDFLFISMLQHFQERGYDSFNFGLSALAGVGDSKESRKLERVLHYLYEHLDRFYNFQGLHAYKEKFRPRWEPRYLVYPSLTALPDVVVALVRADSGDRLLDYFRPGA
jgi:phosphatidylglycerol lysyltransferase